MRRVAGKASGGHVIRAMCILLLLALLIGILITEAARSAGTYSYEAAKVATYTVTDSFSAYVFRDETAFRSSNNGPVEYLVEDGAAVGAGESLANVYGGSAGEFVQREEAAALYEEIGRLENALERDVIPWQAAYTESYAALMNAMGAGDLQAGLRAGEALAATLERRSAFGDSESAVRVQIATLRARVDELVRYEDAPHTLTAKENGYFTYETDGYEALFGVSAIESLTPESLNRLLATPQTDALSVGKLVSGGTFCLAVTVAPEVAQGYTSNVSYRVRMARGGETDMQLVRMSPSDDGSAILLVFRADQRPADMDFSRRQPIEVDRECVTGIRIPAMALYSENGENAVYIASDGIAGRRRVEILCRDGGCCIAAIRSDTGYLREGENILITSRSVYEGKVLNR